MFFTVSNDGETYRYTTHTFTFKGGCEPNTFTGTMYTLTTILLAILGVAGLLAFLLSGCNKKYRHYVVDGLSHVGIKIGADEHGVWLDDGWQQLEEEGGGDAEYLAGGGGGASRSRAPRSCAAPLSGVPRGVPTPRRLDLDVGALEVHTKSARRLLAAEARTSPGGPPPHAPPPALC